jgi:NADP-dependent 3-hydroxy acid dehydrogenase YdfG
VQNAADVAAFVDKLPADWQNIDILLNNAGSAILAFHP